MKVYLVRVGSTVLAEVMAELAVHSRHHELADSPEAADLVLMCGSFSYNPADLLDHPVYLAHRRKCAVYSCDDAYLALAPGVYASPRRGLSSAAGRVRSHAYASSFGIHGNTAVEEARRDLAEQGAAGMPADDTEAPATRYLFSFVGSPTSTFRRRLFRRLGGVPDSLVVDSKPFYRHFDSSAAGRDDAQAAYVDTLRSSQFALCPRGWGTGSLRLFEVMSLGVAPVLLADAYVLPRGPDWDSFLLRVPERQMKRLPEILRMEAATSVRRGHLARAEWERWFSEAVVFDGVVDAAAEALAAGRALDPLYRRLPFLLVGYFHSRLWATQTAARMLARARAAVAQRRGGTPWARSGTTPARRATDEGPRA